TAWENFLTASLQRIMQALGAYCFLSGKKGIASFEQYIEPGARRLREVVRLFPASDKILANFYIYPHD
ncbi:MAG: hypothetical protein LBQ87_02715, partial [Candidatus Fibromonas sp.]|nr:hypothetical protein [Candidatus Fibromonas sp.]